MLTYKKTKLLVPQITHLSKLALDGVERVLVGLFFALSKVIFIAVN